MDSCLRETPTGDWVLGCHVCSRKLKVARSRKIFVTDISYTISKKLILEILWAVNTICLHDHVWIWIQSRILALVFGGDHERSRSPVQQRFNVSCSCWLHCNECVVRCQVEQIFQKHFGFSSFKPGQLEAVLAILHGRDVFALQQEVANILHVSACNNHQYFCYWYHCEPFGWFDGPAGWSQ